MNSSEHARFERKVSRWAVSIVVWTSCLCAEVPNAWAQVAPSSPLSGQQQAAESLNGKSNEELVRLLIGGKSVWKLEREEQRANEVKTHFPDRFWEMPPKEAALALVQDNCNLKLKPLLKISVREDKGRPPDKGGVQLRLEYAHYNVPRETLLNLESNGPASTLSFSVVEIRGPVKRSRVEAALRRATRCNLSAEEARRIYEIIWWLGRVQFDRPEQEAKTDEATTERIVADHSTHGRLSVEPGGLRKRKFTLCPASIGECYYETFDNDLYAGFVALILQERLKRHGVDLSETTAVLGEESYSSAEEKFVYTTKPPPPNDPGTPKWINRMLRNLDEYRSSVISDLASLDEPLRYTDPRIDEALFRVARQGLTPRAPDRRTGQSDFEDAARAAHALATRKRAEAFPIIMQLLERGDSEMRHSKDELLDAASLLSSAKPEFEQKLVEYLTAQFVDLAHSPHSSSVLFDSVWRANLRALTPLLEKIATASSEEIEAERSSSSVDSPPAVVGRFHGARRILIAWRESDALTKLKLDAIIEASSFHLGDPAQFLRQEFDALAADQQQSFIAFVRWLDEQKPEDTSWDTQTLVSAFVGSN